MNTYHIRGMNVSRHTKQLAAATTLVFAGIFIFSLPFMVTAEQVPPQVPAPVVDPLSFTVTEGEEYTDTLTATYTGGGTVSFGTVQAPYLGTLLFYPDGTFTYEADVQDQTQGPGTSDSFIITASADGLTSAPETVQISITPLPDVTPPVLHSVEVYNHFGEVSGDNRNISVSVNDYRSNVAEVCLWIGDGSENLFPGVSCKDISEKDWNSYVYAPSFLYGFDSRLIPDGTYPMYVFMTDGVGNSATATARASITVNNESLGSASLPAEITTCEELQAINDHPGWYYELMNDIDCSDTRTWNGGDGFETVTIGTSLMGNNHSISGIFMDTNYTGVTQVEGGATVHGVNLRDVDLTCHSSYCGGFAHNIFGTVAKSSITGTLRCGGKCGGFAAQHSGLITQSWGGMTISGHGGSASGFAGHSSNGEVKNSYFRGHLETGNGGGITGLNDGWNGVGMVDTSYAANTFSEASLAQAGGLIGWQYVGDQARSYWDAELSGVAKMCGQGGTNCQNDHGLTTEQMKTEASYEGWDFSGTWAIDPAVNDGYPYLAWQTSFYEVAGDDDQNDEEPSDDDTPVVIEPVEEERSSGGGGTRVGQRGSETAPTGVVLGAETDRETEQRLEQQRQIVALLQELVALLRQIIANQ
jgi:hypothetical protein